MSIKDQSLKGSSTKTKKEVKEKKEKKEKIKNQS